MALHTRAQFAELCGLKEGTARAYISTNIKRGKILPSGDYIDDTIPENAEFIKKQKLKNLFKDETPITKEPEPETPPKKKQYHYVKPDKDLPEPPNVQDPVDDDLDDETELPDSGELGEDFRSMSKLNKKKLVVEIQKKQREIALLRLREEKLNAIVIPTELVKVMFSQHTRSISTGFKNSLDNILTLIAKQAGLNINQIAELRGKLVGEINTAVDKSVIESKKNLNNIIKEFVERKEVGERG